MTPQGGPGACLLQRAAHHSRMLHLLACLPLLPATTWGMDGNAHTRMGLVQATGVAWAPRVQCLCEPQGHGSFGCWVDLPLGSRSADLHSTAVWCRTLLHSSPQPHAVGLSHPSPDGVLATTTKICARRHFSWGQPQQALQSPMSFYMPMLCSAATVAVDCEANSASLTWAPSIFGAARFGR